MGGILAPEPQGLGKTEQKRPTCGADRVRETEDHGGQPDVAFPWGLALPMSKGASGEADFFTVGRIIGCEQTRGASGGWGSRTR